MTRARVNHTAGVHLVIGAFPIGLSTPIIHIRWKIPVGMDPPVGAFTHRYSSRPNRQAPGECLSRVVLVVGRKGFSDMVALMTRRHGYSWAR